MRECATCINVFGGVAAARRQREEKKEARRQARSDLKLKSYSECAGGEHPVLECHTLMHIIHIYARNYHAMCVCVRASHGDERKHGNENLPHVPSMQAEWRAVFYAKVSSACVRILSIYIVLFV